MSAFLDSTKTKRQQLLDAARKVHRNTGHQPPGELARLLRETDAPPASRAAMEPLKCSSCIEHSRPQSTPVATLSTATAPWKVLAMDFKEYHVGDHKCKYLLFVDEATRLVRIKCLVVLTKAQHRNATTLEIVNAFEEE